MPHGATGRSPSGPALGRRMNQQGLWEAGFVVSRGWGDPWFPWEGVMSLFE